MIQNTPPAMTPVANTPMAARDDACQSNVVSSLQPIHASSLSPRNQANLGDTPGSSNRSSSGRRRTRPRLDRIGQDRLLGPVTLADQQATERLDTDHDRSVGPGRDRLSKATNRKVVADICHALRQDAATAGSVRHCEIDVDGDGVVTMSGTVMSQAVKDLFNSKASATAGVSRVENHCQVAAAGGERSVNADRDRTSGAEGPP